MRVQAHLAFLILPWCSVYSNLEKKKKKKHNVLEIDSSYTSVFFPALALSSLHDTQELWLLATLGVGGGRQVQAHRLKASLLIPNQGHGWSLHHVTECLIMQRKWL